MSPNPMPEALTLPGGQLVRPLSGLSEMLGACRIYSEVFAYQGEHQGLNPRTLQSLSKHGGSVVGVIDPQADPDHAVRAMAFGWTAVDQTPADPHVYHWSQAAVVAADMQGKGVGRAMKTVQAAVAQAAGAQRMRWTYDPLLARNAHFNLDVLGALGRWYEREAQGTPGSDRITVDWAFGSSPGLASESGPLAVEEEVPPPPMLGAGDLHTEATTAHLGIPAAKSSDEGLNTALRESFAALFSQGFAAVSCTRVGEDVAVYRFDVR